MHNASAQNGLDDRCARKRRWAAAAAAAANARANDAHYDHWARTRCVVGCSEQVLSISSSGSLAQREDGGHSSFFFHFFNFFSFFLFLRN
jgi:hypothetical protein